MRNAPSTPSTGRNSHAGVLATMAGHRLGRERGPSGEVSHRPIGQALAHAAPAEDHNAGFVAGRRARE